MKSSSFSPKQGFTLLETVIAIGVLAVLLTGFMVVFTPAAEGIRRSITVQQADRLASSLEQELVTLRETEKSTDYATGFDKAFTLIEDSMAGTPKVVFVYQYRGDLTKSLRTDGTYEPYVNLKSGTPGTDYTVVTMARRLNQLTGTAQDTLLRDDLTALEGRVFAVKMTQLVYKSGALELSTANSVESPTTGTVALNGNTASGKYPEAVIAFSAEFFGLQSSSYEYLRTNLNTANLKNPIFVRNLAVRR